MKKIQIRSLKNKFVRTELMRFDTLHEWLDWLEVSHPIKIDLGLERVSSVADTLELLNPDAQVITIGGTNGKGSTVAMFEHILAQSDVTTGSYTSPHLHEFNERIRINSVPVGDQKIMQAFAAIDAARAETSLSYFEFSTLAALYIHQQAGVEVMLLEVGLGGRLDATNMVDADIAIITNIALDHMDYLGDTVELIATEKAAIARVGRPLICSSSKVTPVLEVQARQHGAEFVQAGQQYQQEVFSDHWNWSNEETQYQNLPLPGLLGQHQFYNAGGVIAALQYLPPSLKPDPQAIAVGLQSCDLPGRFERVWNGGEVIFDVAHNPHSADALVANLAALEPLPTHVILGILADKDYTGLIAALAPQVRSWHLSAAAVERALTTTELKATVQRIAPQAQITCYDTLGLAYRQLEDDLDDNNRILVTGSFHTVDEVRRLVKEGKTDN